MITSKQRSLRRDQQAREVEANHKALRESIVTAHVDLTSALDRGVGDRLRDAHARWEEDCLALDHELSDAGLPFGASGYKIAVERGAYRLVEGVSDALGFVSKNIVPGGPNWQLAHGVILEAVEQHFLARSRLVPAPAAEPVLNMVACQAREQVMRHCDQVSARGWSRCFVAAICWVRALLLRNRYADPPRVQCRANCSRATGRFNCFFRFYLKPYRSSASTGSG